jgi:mono/diheme cytochrome c family protein
MIRFTVALGLGAMAYTVLGIAAGGEPAVPETPTFSKDVAPILYKNCVVCHRPGAMAPMSLVSYESARPWARAIAEKVADGTMPPFHAVAPAGTFANERRLTGNERETILQWVKSGAPMGDPKHLPAPPEFPTDWTIGRPDAVFAMETDFEVPATGEIPYKYFSVPTNLSEDKWVQAIEIRPGSPSVVHHVLAFSRDPNAIGREPAFALRVPAVGTRQAGGTSSNSRGVLIATTAPGTNAQIFPEGHAMRIGAGSVLTFQVHYTANGKATRDKTAIAFVFAKRPPEHEVFSSAFSNPAFVIPAGDSNFRVDSAIEFLQNARILAIFPHTHVRGKSWEYSLVYPDGRSEVVLSVPRYDFNWQIYYEFVKPLSVSRGARLEGTARYDNSPANRANPDPTQPVRWGDQTWEEMQYTGITFVLERH